MRDRRAAVVCCALLALLVPVSLVGGAEAAPGPVPEGTLKGDAGTDIRVGSFNIRAVDKFEGQQDELRWSDRRATVVDQILGENVDVIGVQEASPNPNFEQEFLRGQSVQYMDLLAALNLRDPLGLKPWAITNPVPYNCARPDRQYNCVPVDNDASRDSRILYNSSKLAMLEQDAFEYTQQTGTLNNYRYIAYAKFKVLANGSEFWFFSTHLTNNDVKIQVSQWYELMNLVDRVSGNDPAVIVGDFQKSKWAKPMDVMIPTMKKRGYGSVVSQKFGSNYVTRQRAEKLTNGWFGTTNHFRRDTTNWAQDDRSKLGNNVDWIFATNSLPVREWKVVLNLTRDKSALKGPIPSDHNMVRATLTLPDPPVRPLGD